MLHKENITIPTTHGKPIMADICYDSSSTNRSIVMFCHGYKGFKDWGAWELVSEAFANNGYFFVKFNFSHNGGTSDQLIDFPDLEAFGNNKFTIELDDIESILNYLEAKNQYRSQYTMDNLSIIGHSRGGGVSIIKASIDNRIKRLISWAAIADIEKRYPKGELMKEWKTNGVRYVLNGRTNQKMPHYYSFYQDFLEHEELLNIESATKKIKIPHLIINGMADIAVRPDEAKLLQEWNPEAQLILINRCGHTFGSKHPWERMEMPIFLTQVVEDTLNFLKNLKY